MNKSAISLSIVILKKLNYKSTTPKELEEELLKLTTENHV